MPPTATSGTVTASLTGLQPSTTYYFAPTVTVGGTGSYAAQSAVVVGSIASFTTTSAEPAIARAWAELPAASESNSNYYVGTFYAGSERNYTYLYDRSTYTSYWVAYPLIASQTTGTRSGTWKQNPNIAASDQINIWTSSYGVNYGSTDASDYNSTLEFYARGHQIPDGDRSGVSAMQEQTYYATNSTPQIQNKFNGGIWNQLEDAVRGAIPSSDTLYVVTGATLRKVGGNETITYIHPKNDASKNCPVPNYYYKVLLKVKRSGNTITDASAIGFWLPHTLYNDGSTWGNYAVSVDQIEQWTGFNFFVNLPSAVESSAESNSSWTTFGNF